MYVCIYLFHLILNFRGELSSISAKKALLKVTPKINYICYENLIFTGAHHPNNILITFENKITRHSLQWRAIWKPTECKAKVMLHFRVEMLVAI